MTPHTDDGFVRVSLDTMLSLPMRHLMSGLDEDTLAQCRCGTPTSISGYMEWVGTSLSHISLGWDWRLEITNGVLRYVRVGLPRSNVMLVDERHFDYGWQRNLQALATVVDALQWQKKASRLIS
jgi:hypothetical protein